MFQFTGILNKIEALKSSASQVCILFKRLRTDYLTFKESVLEVLHVQYKWVEC